MLVYYFLAALATWFGIQSLLNGFRYAAYVRRETSLPLPEFQPFASVIVPAMKDWEKLWTERKAVVHLPLATHLNRNG